jgi:hypothetical protein
MVTSSLSGAWGNLSIEVEEAPFQKKLVVKLKRPFLLTQLVDLEEDEDLDDTN